MLRNILKQLQHRVLRNIFKLLQHSEIISNYCNHNHDVGESANPWSHSYLAMDTICPILAPLRGDESGGACSGRWIWICLCVLGPEYLLGWDGCCLNGEGSINSGGVVEALVLHVECYWQCATLMEPRCSGPLLLPSWSSSSLDQIRKSERPPADPRPVSPVLHSS